VLKYLLDTNIAIYVIKHRPIQALETFNRHTGQLCISTITLAELFHGAEKSAKTDHNLRQVEDFVSRLEVLEYGTKAAAHYGDIRANLERKGTPIGVNDLHIAAHARSEALMLVSNNLREFERVEALRLENWV
jgi:tRNA(fMet)-specific endonuclease VapC